MLGRGNHKRCCSLCVSPSFQVQPLTFTGPSFPAAQRPQVCSRVMDHPRAIAGRFKHVCVEGRQLLAVRNGDVAAAVALQVGVQRTLSGSVQRCRQGKGGEGWAVEGHLDRGRACSGPGL